MRKKQPYGGLSPHHVRAIRAYLRRLQESEGLNHLATFGVWLWLVYNDEETARERSKEAGFSTGTVNALKAGIEVLRRKRIGRLMSLSAHGSFKALGIA